MFPYASDRTDGKVIPGHSNDSNIVRYRHIEPGQLVDDTLRQVISGIRPDEQYVTTALLKVRDGMSIKPIK